MSLDEAWSWDIPRLCLSMASSLVGELSQGCGARGGECGADAGTICTSGVETRLI